MPQAARAQAAMMPIFLAGRPARTVLRVQNATHEAWKPDGPDRVIAAVEWMNASGVAFEGGGQRLPLTTETPPGGVVVLGARLPPAPAGAMALRTTILREAGPTRLAVQDDAVQVLAFDDYARGSVTLLEAPPGIPAGAAILLRLRVANDGTAVWNARPPQRVHLVAVMPDGARVVAALPADLAPDAAVEMRLALTAPATPGRHAIRIGLEREIVGDFTEATSFVPAVLDLDVIPPGQTEVPQGFRPDSVRLRIATTPGAEPVAEAGREFAVPLVIANNGPSLIEAERLAWRWSRLTESVSPGPADHRPGFRQVLDGGGTARFVLRLAAPPLAGRYRLDFTVAARANGADLGMVAAGALEFAILPASVFRGSAEPLQRPTHMLCGEPQLVAWRISNGGDAAWTAHGEGAVALRQRWRRLDAAVAAPRRPASSLGADLRAGAAALLEVALMPPAEPGRYAIDLQPERLGTAAPEPAPDFAAGTLEVELVAPTGLDWPQERALRAELARVTQAARREAYRDWAATQDTTDATSIAATVAGVVRWPRRPVISVLMPLAEAVPEDVAAAIESVRVQAYPHWELCIAPDGAEATTTAALLHAAAAADARIRVAPPAGTLDAALAQAGGAYCLRLDPRDRLAAHALLFIAGEAVRDDAAEWIGMDADAIDAGGARLHPVFGGLPDADLLCALPGSLPEAAISTAVLRTVLAAGGAAALAPWLDSALRLTEGAAHRARHIPIVLYHRRQRPQDDTLRTLDAAQPVISAHLARTGSAAAIERRHDRPGFRLRHPLPQPAPLASVIIPTRDRIDLLRPCIASILDRTDYPAVEIIVVDNGSTAPEAVAYLGAIEAAGTARVLHLPGPFNWSRANNLGAAVARGEVLVLLNDDVEAINESWLRELVSQALRPGVGAVGAALFFPDGRVQHGGIVFQPGTGAALHAHYGLRREELGTQDWAVQGMTAVTGACLATRRDVFLAAGGIDEQWLPVVFNDADYCLRVTERLGLRCIWTPHAELFHRQSATLGPARSEAARERTRRERAVFRARWRETIVEDPFHRPALTPLQDRAGWLRPGAASHLARYRLPRPPALAWMHIPGTVGAALRARLLAAFPAPLLGDIAARTVLRCLDGDAAAIAQAARRLRDAEIGFGNFPRGFGALVGWRCVHATVLRDPFERVVAHHRRLLHEAEDRLGAARLAAAPLGLLVRKGVIPGNLMTRMILGERTDAARWEEIDGKGAALAGYGLPAAIWTGGAEAVLDGPDVAPQEDLALAQHAIGVIGSDFAFVGQQDRLAEQWPCLMAMLRAAPGGPAPAALRESTMDAADRAEVERHNRLDIALVEHLAARPGGCVLNPALLEGF